MIFCVKCKKETHAERLREPSAGKGVYRRPINRCLECGTDYISVNLRNRTRVYLERHGQVSLPGTDVQGF
jgi:hypothetical protein